MSPAWSIFLLKEILTASSAHACAGLLQHKKVEFSSLFRQKATHAQDTIAEPTVTNV